MSEILPITSEPAARIVDEAERRLCRSPYFFLRKLRCQFDAGTLTLVGQVPYWQLRQFAEAIVSRVEGVQRVANRVEIFDPMAGPSGAPRVRSAG
jgi:osmotically-inducible protein OsmY